MITSSFITLFEKSTKKLKIITQSIKAIKEKTAESIIGTPYPNSTDNTPPIAGPKTNPSANADPSIPIPFDLPSFVVISETTA